MKPTRSAQALNISTTLLSRRPLKLPAQQVEEFPELSGYSALIVDDDRDACESIGLILQESGVRANWVNNGPAAVEQVYKAHEEKDDYCVVILDWRMPGMDGLETARQIRGRLGSEVPILLLSAYDWESVKEEALEAGINGFLTKPIFRTELLEQMKYYIWDKNKETEKQETEKAVTAKLQPEEAENLQGIRILTAEDNELNREIIVELLENSGAVVDSAQNGKEALDYYLNSSPGYYHLILMDVNMPVMDGLEAVRAIRDSGREDAAMIPVIAMTADVFKEDINKCREAGMNAHIGKPVELDKLYSTLRRFLNTGKSGEM